MMFYTRRKLLAAMVALAATQLGYGQSQNAEPVLQIERAFAAHSVQHGMRAAFLHFLDSAGLVFERGKILNGLEVWRKRADAPGVLSWHPVYGDLASSGDIGFTTGPWTFQPKTTSDSIVARGQYSTIWKKSKAGEWKFILDMGLSPVPEFSVPVVNPNANQKFVRGTLDNLLRHEQAFLRQTASASVHERKGAYAAAISTGQFFLNRAGRVPAMTASDLDSLIGAMPASIYFTMDGLGISAAGDIGYVFGTTVIANKTDNYLRIWRREGRQWRLALEVLPY